MAQYVVKSGDNLSTIAQRYGVPISAISGYRSGNPNLIYPGEVLNIGTTGQVSGAAATTTSGAKTFGELLANIGYKAPTTTQQTANTLSTYTNAPYSTTSTPYNPPAAEPTGATIPAFNFDWAAEEKAALEKLTPYYEKKLAEAQGDVDFATQMIEKDYQSGLRYNEGQKTSQTEEATRLSGEELTKNISDLNKRGVLFGEKDLSQETTREPYSQLASSYYLDPLAQRQKARQEAIERAFTRTQETSDITRESGLRSTQRDFEKYKQAIEEEKQKRAMEEIPSMRYQQELAKYNALTSQSLGG